VTGLDRIIITGVPWESDSRREAAKLKSLLRDSQSLALHHFRENWPQRFSLFRGSGNDSLPTHLGPGERITGPLSKTYAKKLKAMPNSAKIPPARRHQPKEPISRSISANQLGSAITVLLTNQERGVREM
jgi:hypothetical protein